MKKYLITAGGFVLNNEILSWILITIIAAMALIDFVKAVDKEREARKWTD